MNDKIVLITKDALTKEYLPTYGNDVWATPNIDELAKKGTVFNNFYTAAPSSFMSYQSMFTGQYPYKSAKKKYVPDQKKYKRDSLFDKAFELGYESHIMWDESWTEEAVNFSDFYGRNTTIHSIKELRQGVGSHYKHDGKLERDYKIAQETIDHVKEKIKNISNNNGKVFLWIHLPHVINGRISYGDDIDLFDQVVGILRRYFLDQNIFISADHGNMNGHKNKIGYGFDVYEPSVCIPMISPRIDNLREYNENTVNIDMFDLIFKRKLKVREFIYLDTAYYAQPHRKLAILYKDFKYIYNKKDGSEELYDLSYDPIESCNLINDIIYDIDRKVDTPLRELYFYPDWVLVEDMRVKFRNERKRIWREEELHEKIYEQIKEKLKIIYRKISMIRNYIK